MNDQQRAAMQRALDWITEEVGLYGSCEHGFFPPETCSNKECEGKAKVEVITALREALEVSSGGMKSNSGGMAHPQPQGEPVAWEELLGAVARGWCRAENLSKTMDSDLAVAIAKEVQSIFYKLPCCGYANPGSVMWNKFNGVIQCHNCGQIYHTPPSVEAAIEATKEKAIEIVYGIAPLEDSEQIAAAIRSME